MISSASSTSRSVGALDEARRAADRAERAHR
jgi:hypothetical protein